MNILIVEDDSYKSEALVQFIESEFFDVNIILRNSLSSGILEIMSDSDLDVILLDMSMPSYDVTPKDPSGGVPESFAGVDFLSHMDLMGLNIPVVVVTQFENFEDMHVNVLIEQLCKEYKDIFMGWIYFKSTSSEWKYKLSEVIKRVVG